MHLNELQRFAKNFFFKIITTLITGLTSILIVSHLSNALQPDGFGKYNFLLTYTSYFIFLTSLGTDIVAIRMMAAQKEKIREILGSLISLKLILTIVVFIIMLIPMIFVPKLQNFGCLLVIFSTTILPFPFSVQCVFEATKRLEFPSIITIVSQLVNYLLIRLFVNTPDDLFSMGLILIFINLIIFITHTIIFKKYYGMWKLTINRVLWISFLTNGVIIGFIQIITSMNQYFNILLLGFMKSDYDVGIFSAAYRVMFMILSVILIFLNLMTPILFENYTLNIEKFRFYFDHYLKFITFFSIFTACMSFFLSEPILNIFYNLETYHGTILCFQILTGSILLIGVYSPFNIGLIAMHKESSVLKIIIFQFIMNITGNIIMIPKYGIYGSAIVTVLTDLVCFPIYIYTYGKLIHIKLLRHYLLATISIIPVALVLYFLNIHFVLKAIVGTMTMVLSTLLFRGYTLEEIKFMKQTLFSFKNNSS